VESEARRARAYRLSAEATAEAARHEAREARAMLARGGKPPGGGEKVVVRSRRPEGDVRRPGKRGRRGGGDPAAGGGGPGRIEVEVDVLSPDAVRIRPGTPVRFRRWGGEGPLEGRVRVVEPSGFTKVSALGVEEQRVWVIADITSPREAWERIGDGYRLEASFVLWEGKDVLQVPEAAVFRAGARDAVFVVEKGRARIRYSSWEGGTGSPPSCCRGSRRGDGRRPPGDAVADGRRVAPR
jgi:HlyD family secretion protein